MIIELYKKLDDYRAFLKKYLMIIELYLKKT